MNGRLICLAVVAYIAFVLLLLAFMKGATQGDPE